MVAFIAPSKPVGSYPSLTPRAPECWARHHTVLDTEQAEQRDVDEERRSDRSRRTTVDRFRHQVEISKERNEIQEDRQEHEVARNTVDDR